MKKCFFGVKTFLEKTVYLRNLVTKNQKEQKNAFSSQQGLGRS